MVSSEAVPEMTKAEALDRICTILCLYPFTPVDQIVAYIQKLEDRVNEAESMVSAFDDANDSLKYQVDGLQVEVDALKAKIKSLEGKAS